MFKNSSKYGTLYSMYRSISTRYWMQKRWYSIYELTKWNVAMYIIMQASHHLVTYIFRLNYHFSFISISEEVNINTNSFSEKLLISIIITIIIFNSHSVLSQLKRLFRKRWFLLIMSWSLIKCWRFFAVINFLKFNWTMKLSCWDIECSV